MEICVGSWLGKTMLAIDLGFFKMRIIHHLTEPAVGRTGQAAG